MKVMVRLMYKNWSLIETNVLEMGTVCEIIIGIANKSVINTFR